MVHLQSTGLSAALVLSLLLACGSDPAPAEVADGGDVAALNVTSTEPSKGGADVPLNVLVTASFDAEMDPSTVNATSFTVQQGGQPVAGTVACAGSTATFTPTADLASRGDFTATITTAARDVDGHALDAPYAWSFATGTTSALGPAPVSLGAAGRFVILAKTAISSVPTSVLTGDVGLSPAAATYATGFSLVADPTNVFATSTQVTGKVYAASYASPTPTQLTTAVHDMEHAYTDAAGRPTPDFLELGTGNLGGLTLVPGLYKWTSAVSIPTEVTLAGGANDVWIFQTTGNLTVAAAKSVVLSGGARAKNVYWQVAGQVTVAAGAHLEGIVLCKTAITLQTGASLNGRALAQTQVALQKATVTQPAP